MTSSSDSAPTQRFSDRVANYVRYRPGYPDHTLKILADETSFGSGSIVADVGSGTGISSDLFLRSGATVYGIEPNQEMREAAEARLGDRPRFHSVSGTAEATTLPAASMTHVCAAQAFHWFRLEETRAEFQRILQPGGWGVLLWNRRLLDATPFLRDYEALLLEYATDYEKVRHENVDEAALGRFFTGGYTERVLPNSQSFDYEGLEGRLLSSSYAPGKGHPRHEPMLEALKKIFAAYEEKGIVRFEYDTQIFFGHV